MPGPTTRGKGPSLLTLVVCLMLFVLLTIEHPSMFANRMQTIMNVGFPVFTTRLPDLPFSPWDLVMGLIGVAVCLQPSTWRRRARPLDLALLASGAGIAVAVVWGRYRGGNVTQMYFQLMGLILLFLLTHVLLAVCRRPSDIRWIVGTVMVAAVYRATACLYFYVFYVRGGKIEPYPQQITSHDDSALWAFAAVMLVAWAFSREKAPAWIAASVLLILVLLAVNYNNRRLAWVEVVGGLAMLLIAIPRGRHRKRLIRWVLVALPVLVLYTAVGWNRYGGVFAPIPKLKSVLGVSEDDSSKSRDVENTGLIVTLMTHRVMGTGYGHEYYEVSWVYSLGMQGFFSQYLYMPHNSLLAIVVYTGILLFPVVWIPLPVGAFLAARAAAAARSRGLRALALTAFAVPFIYSVQAYGDMGLQSMTSNALLAVAFAVGARLAVLSGAWPTGPRRRPVPPAGDTGAPSALEPVSAGS